MSTFQDGVNALADKVTAILKERSKGEVETWGFVAAFLEMIDEAKAASLSPSPQPQVSKAQPSAETQPIVDLPSAETGCDWIVANKHQPSTAFFGTPIPRVPASDPRYVKHVVCEGARFHVVSYSGGVGCGTRMHCSEADCIINAPENRAQRAPLTSSDATTPPATSVPPLGEWDKTVEQLEQLGHEKQGIVNNVPASPPLPVDEEHKEGEKQLYGIWNIEGSRWIVADSGNDFLTDDWSVAVATVQKLRADGAANIEIKPRTQSNQLYDELHEQAGVILQGMMALALEREQSSSLRQRLHKVEEERDQLLATAKAQATREEA